MTRATKRRVKARVMWTTSLAPNHGQITLFSKKILLHEHAVAVIPLDDLDALVEQIAQAHFEANPRSLIRGHDPRRGDFFSDIARAVLKSLGIAPRGRKAK